MVKVSSVKALYHKVSWESEILTDFNALFVNVLCGKVLCHAAVVRIREFCLVVLVVEEVVNINIIHVALDALKVQVLRLLLTPSIVFGSSLTACRVIVFILFFRVIFISFL